MQSLLTNQFSAHYIARNPKTRPNHRRKLLHPTRLCRTGYSKADPPSCAQRPNVTGISIHHMSFRPTQGANLCL